jgi:ElaB/YqjD/DUF883 family membrane-anchored ribosome-binding protein
MPDTKRNEIKQKVTAAENRNEARAEPKAADSAGEKAVELKDKIGSFARQHPIAVMAGGLAVGILVSSFFRGSPTRKAGRAIGKKTAGLAAIAAELALAYAQQIYKAAEEARETGADQLGTLGETISDSARGLTEDAADYAAAAAEAARKTGKSAIKSIRSRLH